MPMDPKIARLHTPAAREKRKKTRAANKAKREATSISGHARRYGQMTKQEFQEDEELTVNEYIAKSLIAGAADRNNKNHVLYTRELMDRTEGKSRQKEPEVKIRKVEEIQRLPDDLSDVESQEAWLRENGFDEAADALVRGIHERSQRADEPASGEQ